MWNILATDSCQAASSLAIIDSKGGRFESHLMTGRTHSQQYLPLVAEGLQQMGLSAADLDLFVVITGPGSYTGARIAVASTQAFAYATGRLCLGVSALEALAHPFRGFEDCLLAVFVDARNHRAYSCAYAGTEAQSDESAADLAELAASYAAIYRAGNYTSLLCISPEPFPEARAALLEALPELGSSEIAAIDRPLRARDALEIALERLEAAESLDLSRPYDRAQDRELLLKVPGVVRPEQLDVLYLSQPPVLRQSQTVK
ncbi:MAG: tRNA (adenosine(37)-N6)-threonylcarbamoyltransferase complex dimerization subunit type 1 TsaB [Eubacteriales bacterium]|nr:tRNA (adenosine(37)-N6)-threonylcarbamoyltransferase complex dimerization subunit type 1 TsaB [Eubacteriales bacterium]